MKREPIFKGACTALITPTNENGVDYEAFKRLIDFQINSGINALAFASTTGEKSTFNDDEHKAILEFAVSYVAGRVPVIAGTGSNDTNYSVQMTRHACELGVDAVLCVTPYYNKCTQGGLVASFNKIADAATKPVILYNVPSRTGVAIQPETYAKLGEHENIVAIKEANGDISKIVETFALAGDKLDVYSGNDDQIVPILSMGGLGVISVVSNPMPAETALMCKKFFDGDVAGAAKMQKDLLPFINALFSEVNPIPVKAAMNAMGYCENYLRLPLTPMEDVHKKVLLDIMRGLSLI